MTDELVREAAKKSSLWPGQEGGLIGFAKLGKKVPMATKPREDKGLIGRATKNRTKS